MEEQKFEPFQKVLVRVCGEWCAAFYSHRVESSGWHVTTNYSELRPDKILPYNDETKHLLGTEGDFKPKYEPKPGELVAVWGDDPKHVVAREYVKKSADGKFVCLYGGYKEDRHDCEAEWPNCAPLRKYFNVPKE